MGATAVDGHGEGAGPAPRRYSEPQAYGPSGRAATAPGERRKVRWQAFWVFVLMAVIAMSWLLHDHPWRVTTHHHVQIGSVRPE